MSPTRIVPLAGALFIGVGSVPAQAHPLEMAGAAFGAGLAHPLGGPDHLLAMVAVGLWAAQWGGRALWLLPATFLTTMTVGLGLALGGLTLPLVEPLISASVLVLGALVALALRPHPALGVALVALFALFHGHAHGVEMPLAAAPLLYGVGFLLASALLHALGIAGVMGLSRVNPRGSWANDAVRTMGGAVAAWGVVLLLL